MRQYLCLLVTSVGFQIPFFLRMEKEQAVIITSSVMEFQRCVLLPSMEHAFLGLF